IAKQIDPGKRVAIDQDEIGERPFLDDPKSSCIRRTWPGERKKLGIFIRYELQYLGRREPLLQFEQIAVLTHVEFGFEEKIGSPGEFYAKLLRILPERCIVGDNSAPFLAALGIDVRIVVSECLGRKP